jgi:hypothetical protein
MDASLLLDAFNMDDIDVDIWDNYNLFTDDNIISVQDSIKEENIGMIYIYIYEECFCVNVTFDIRVCNRTDN